ncbi:MAG: hypothetical protein ACI841_004044 [Planctomycetota bacterium]|jgi:hypothetical protein
MYKFVPCSLKPKGIWDPATTTVNPFPELVISAVKTICGATRNAQDLRPVPVLSIVDGDDLRLSPPKSAGDFITISWL